MYEVNRRRQRRVRTLRRVMRQRVSPGPRAAVAYWLEQAAACRLKGEKADARAYISVAKDHTPNFPMFDPSGWGSGAWRRYRDPFREYNPDDIGFTYGEPF
jgi:hypothetical protein